MSELLEVADASWQSRVEGSCSGHRIAAYCTCIARSVPLRTQPASFGMTTLQVAFSCRDGACSCEGLPTRHYVGLGPRNRQNDTAPSLPFPSYLRNCCPCQTPG